VAELRAATQPPSIFARNSGEHWGGRLYMRRLSPYLTRVFVRAGLAPNTVTALMIVDGLAAAALLTIPGLLPAIGALLLIQLQLLLDCSDGEVARWRGISTPVGIYLDRVAHYLTEAALPIALGVRADGGWNHLGGYTTLGLVVAVLVLLIKSETALVHVARNESGRPPVEDTVAVAAPRGGLLRTARRLLGRLPFFRAFVAIEATFLILVAAVIDSLAAGLPGSRALVIALIPIGVVTAAGHLAAILTSSRLR
jgi:phosphatidylglycerophosphate synthase